MKEPFAERKQRRSLTHLGGETEVEGDPRLTEILSGALDVQGAKTPEAEALSRAHVHGFHTYPARMHPLTAQRLVVGLSREEDVVLDPFCGSGTVVVEAALAGRVALGTDLNPLAVLLARLKSTPIDAAGGERIVLAAQRVAAFAEARRTKKSGASKRYGAADVELFAPHVLLSLDGLRLGIDAEPLGQARSALELVLSAILVKLSRKTSDTSRTLENRRIAADFPARLFVKKTEELVRNLREIEPRLRSAPAPARVTEDDARELRSIREGSVDLVVSSPPYPGVYDYLEHHELRFRWLRLAAARFAEGEIGAARRLATEQPTSALSRWEAELGATLAAIRSRLIPGGIAVLWMADSAIENQPIRVDALIRKLGAPMGMNELARASQPRPHFHALTERAFRDRPRYEHAIVVQTSREISTPRVGGVGGARKNSSRGRVTGEK